jgi:hypothetical protein
MSSVMPTPRAKAAPKVKMWPVVSCVACVAIVAMVVDSIPRGGIV